MGKSTFNIIYVIQKGKAKADGSAPVVARITVNGEKSHFATRIYVDPDRWRPKEYRTMGQTRDERRINKALDELRVLIKRRYDEMLRHSEVITAGKIKNATTGLDEKAMKLLDLCDRFIEDYRGMVAAKIYGHKTLTRYEKTRSYLSSFLASRYRIDDTPLSDINAQFAKNFDKWLRTTQKIANNTSMKYVRRLKTIYHMAVTNGWVLNNPLAAVKICMEKVNRGYLTTEELKRLQSKKFTTKRLELIRDLFLFFLFTGLAFTDVKQFKPEHIVKGKGSELWIRKARQKTKNMCDIPLLQIPMRIIEAYRDDRGCQKHGVLLPVLCNQRMNSWLREIFD